MKFRVRRDIPEESNGCPCERVKPMLQENILDKLHDFVVFQQEQLDFFDIAEIGKEAQQCFLFDFVRLQE